MLFSCINIPRGCSGHLSVRQASQQAAGDIKSATGLVSEHCGSG